LVEDATKRYERCQHQTVINGSPKPRISIDHAEQLLVLRCFVSNGETANEIPLSDFLLLVENG
jgi:hypothetical protein